MPNLEIARPALLGFLAAFMASHAVSPASAAAFETIFGEGTGCYRRTYTPAHMVDHPRQKTTEIEISYRPRPADRRDGEACPVQVYIFSRYRGDTRPLSGGHEAYCRGDGRTVSCSVEGDAGGFSLAPIGAESIRLTVEERLTIETDTEFVDMHASDDRVFILTKLPASACTRFQ